MPWCHQCQTEYPPGYESCVGCGAPLFGEPPPPEDLLAVEEAQVCRHGRRRQRLLRVLGFVMALVFFAYAVLRSFRA